MVLIDNAVFVFPSGFMQRGRLNRNSLYTRDFHVCEDLLRVTSELFAFFFFLLIRDDAPFFAFKCRIRTVNTRDAERKLRGATVCRPRHNVLRAGAK